VTGRRVAVTGLGVICALGHNLSQVWDALRGGRPGIATIGSLDISSLRFACGAEVRNYEPKKHFSADKLNLTDRFAQFAVIAAREALLDSGVVLTDGLRDRTAVFCGTSMGGQVAQDAAFVDLYQQGRERVHPLTIARIMASAGASHISMEFGTTGPALAISTACSSSNHAIGQAYHLLRNGDADLAVAGGSDAPFSYGVLKAWEAMRVIAPDTCRPFSVDRQGTILGEGGAMLILEPLDAARARGAKVYAEIAGFGMSSDAHHITQSSVTGPARAMRAALRDANMYAEEVGYINAHGTATQSNDSAEAHAILDVFGAGSKRLAVSSTKSMHGHALGAAGALEAVATAMALHEGILPPTANFTGPDPECDLDVVANRARTASVECALSNSFAFGGLNAVLAFRAARN
jgi:nodulation protein E